ncbi:iron-sulfur cluster repair di-iron protein ScdA [Staphylococcus epidermidis]|uniref:iron-sulfur cluster repair di-iron protein ScdA n=1 Tax=Staphylococcus epidermidis TaxID=1282 RepID=UPI000C1697FF|nr:iron-sulfur cluster repair di-iron protein ScdA [Staphylococcus epidermidis]MEB2860272.1 iron-sulfur cluster repair di-iron protein ScdA [Staphylococcus sp. GCP4]ATQ50474.1 iron-sulfur cluster repair di-iron protein ScdA [Staphylococcus epidermidis]MBF2232536.1 iron-sulfur cluster repair di-iron protein ScdA [Staphylococcus epidermidis]MBG3872310.1 iron-sulfur cluster repair di-iron protein ScdA [Staphylococcus epidermidis]MCD8886853.1 iron-sulfur cluster repair di-iron protein ScdA [Staphy
MITKEDIVADVVTDYPKSADIFRNVGIDFCCGGQESIASAVNHKPNIDLNSLLNKLNHIDNTEGNSTINPKFLNVESLIQYIQSAYHETLKEEFKNLTPYVTKLAKVHGPSHPYLLKLQDLYREFRDSMLNHIRKEDEEDFPKLIQYSQGQDVQNIKIILEDLINDHEDTGQLLNVMNQLTSDYQAPEEACGTWKLVYQRLQNIEHQTHQHVHLENHVLFKKVS